MHPKRRRPYAFFRMTLDVAVVGGAGHVGLPLALAFARAGMTVGVYDIAEAKLDEIARGRMPFREAGAEAVLRDVLARGRLTLSSDPSMLRDADVVIIVIGTPIDEFMNPSRAVFDSVVDELAPHLREGALVVLRSTVYPGTTEYVSRRLAALRPGVDVICCPERIVEGQALDELPTLPQIVGADDDRSAERGEQLFRRLGPTTIRVTTKEAEVAKLLTNTWRYMKFAVANQFFMIAHSAGLDYERILYAIRHQYPRARDLPGPGFSAGPCLLKDTMQLAAFTSDHFPLGLSAMQINEGLPAYVVSAVESRYGPLRGRTVGILGMAFKPESDDIRASLSYKLRKLLLWAGATVIATDPYVEDPALKSLDEVVALSDLLVVGVPHVAYRGRDFGGRTVIDIWGDVTGTITI